MEHLPTHDPVLDYRSCSVCYMALSAAWARVTGLPLDTMIPTIRRISKELADEA